MRYRLSTLLLAMAICPPLGAFLFRPRTLGCPSYEDTARSEISMLEDAVEIYRLEVCAQPSTLDDLRCPPVNREVRPRWAGPYISCPIPKDPWGQAYRYQRLSKATFKITSAGGDGRWLTEDDIDPAAERIVAP